MISLKELHSRYEIASNGFNLPEMVIDNVDLLKEIKNYDSLEELIIDYAKNNVFNRNLFSIKSLIYYYAFVKKLTEQDYEYLADQYPDITKEVINPEKEEIQNRTKDFRQRVITYNKIQDSLNDYQELPKHIEEISKTKTYIIEKKEYLPDENPLLTLDDINIIFQLIEPSNFVQMIVFCNSVGKLTYKVSTNYPINYFDEIKNDFEPNTISLLYEVYKKGGTDYKKTVLNFNKSTCVIEIFIKSSDNTEYYIKNLCNKYINFRPNEENDIISGEIYFSDIENIKFLDLYEHFVLNDLITFMFKVDESKKPFCVTKDDFKVIYYDPIIYTMYKFIGDFKKYPNVILTFKNQTKNKDKYVVRYEASNNEIMSSLSKNLSKILTMINGGKTTESFDFTNKFYTTVREEVTKKAPFLYQSLDKSRSISYTSICTADKQPIVIYEEEVDEYIKSGKNVKALEYEDKKYWFTCMTEQKPYILFPKFKKELKTGLKIYPCCYAKEDTVEKRGKNNIKESNNILITSAIKDFSKKSILDKNELCDFLKTGFSEQGDASINLIGTSFSKSSSNEQSLNDSFIGALIQATNQYNFYKSSGEINEQLIYNIYKDVRQRMLKLPFEIYKQELYDVKFEDFVNNILDPDHYIDPYLYYRGLEEIFDVNIFVFTSDMIKKYPSSYEELNSNLPSLEIPRCFDYHTRIKNDRNIVCIYKNYGSYRFVGKGKNSNPSCELISIKTLSGKDNFISSVDGKRNKRYSDFIWNHFYNCCTPIMFQYNNFDEYSKELNMSLDELNNYDITGYIDPFSKYNTIDIEEKIGMTLTGQKIDMYGKVKQLIFTPDDPDENGFVIQIYGMQPLVFNYEYPKPSKNLEYLILEDVFEEVKNGDSNYPNLFEKEELMELFDTTIEEEDGIWIEYFRNPKGMKIICKTSEIKKESQTVTQTIDDLNNTSTLLQLINWLWRSDYDYQLEIFPDFEEWFGDKIEEKEYFEKYENPIIPMNNIYLPKFNTYEERINFCEDRWPFIFYNGKINLFANLCIRILYLMKVQDYQTQLLDFDSEYNKIPEFIVNLTPTDTDYLKNGSLIFNKREHLDKWLKYTNRSIVSNISLTNNNIIYSKIFEQHFKTIKQYYFTNINEPEQNKIYIIQNITNGEKFYTNEESSAVHLARVWSTSYVNLGAGVTSFDIKGLHYVIYEVNENGLLFPTYNSNINSKSSNYLKIIKYRTGNYGAMLELV